MERDAVLIPFGAVVAGRRGDRPAGAFCYHAKQGMVALKLKAVVQGDLRTPQMQFDQVADNQVLGIAQEGQL